MRIKRFLAVFSVILIVVIIAISVFIFTFDANRYKGALITNVERLINKDVKIDDISLNLWHGLAVRVNGISIKSPDKAWKDALLKVSNVDISLKILPLIKKDIQVKNISINGLMLDFTRDSFKIPAPESVGADRNAGAAALGSLKFLAQNISITDSSIRYKDIIQDKVIDLKIDIISAILKNISIYGPVNIDTRLSIFGRGKENIKLKAILYPEIDAKSFYFKNLEFKIDMVNLDIPLAMKALGLKPISGIVGKELSGQVIMSTDKIELDPKKIYDSEIFINVLAAKTDILPIKKPLHDINIKATFNKDVLNIQKFTAGIGNGRFDVSGAIEDVLGRQVLNLGITLKNMEIGDFLPDMPSDSPSFKALLNLDIKGSSSGLSQDTILKTLKAKGRVKIENGLLENMNVLRIALDKLNMLPGLVQRLNDNLPAKYSSLLNQNYTAFKPINADFEIKTGRLFFEKIAVESDTFYLASSGSIGVGQDLDIRSNLFIPKDLSDAFTNVVPELKLLKNDNGMITMPLDIKGRIPNILVMPNLDYVMQKLAVSKGQEILDRIFKKKDEQHEHIGQEKPESQGQEENKEKPVESIIRGVLDILK